MSNAVIKTYNQKRVTIDLSSDDARSVLRALVNWSASLHGSIEDAEGSVSLNVARALSEALEVSLNWPTPKAQP